MKTSNAIRDSLDVRLPRFLHFNDVQRSIWFRGIGQRCVIDSRTNDRQTMAERRSIQGHPPELSDSVKLLLSDAKRHGFEIDQVLKSID